MSEKQFFIYIMTNKAHGVFYTGLTSDLCKRVYEHKEGVIGGFTKRFNLHRLVYVEVYQDFEHAVKREKRLKRWNREWKIEAIESINPNWEDLYEQMCGVETS